MNVMDHLFQFELFSVPVWKMAQNTIAKKDIETFKKRWPVWAKRLKYFPRLRADLFAEIFAEKNIQELQPFQKELLNIFFEHSKIDPTDSLVTNTLSRLCLSHNWEALDAIQRHIPFNAETHTIIACAMIHEANSTFWDHYISRPRISMQTVNKYIEDNIVLPYDSLEDVWNQTVFYSDVNEFKKINTYGIAIKNPIGNHLSVLPNFDQISLWDYTVIKVPNTQIVTKIVDVYTLPPDQLSPIFVRNYPMDPDFVYKIIQENFPLCATLNGLLKEPLELGVDYTNIVGILKETTPAIASAFEQALEQIANETQRQKILDETAPTHHVSRRKM